MADTESPIPPTIPPEENPQDEVFGMPPAFRHLWRLELTIVWAIGLATMFLSVYAALYALFGICPQVHERIAEVVKGVNSAWKLGLLLLIPLFFRPVFKFLIQLREGPFGTKSQLPQTGRTTGDWKKD
jgi:hypothetical protein